MKALFVFDTVIVKDNDDYKAMTLTYHFFKERYLKYFDEMIISTRCKDISKMNSNSIAGYQSSRGEHVTIIPI